MSQVIVPQAVSVLPPTLTKGTQGATGYSTQDLKDSGRVNIMWTVDNFPVVATAEALLTVTESRDGAATSTFTTKAITSGKRLRITSITWSAETGGSAPTVIQRNTLRMRFNTAGAVTTGSPIQYTVKLGTAATVRATDSKTIVFPDGIEFLGDGTKQIGFTNQSPDWVTGTMVSQVSLAVTAFEY